MKMIMKSAAVAGVTALAVTTMLAKGGGGGQPVHTIRFTFKTALTNTDQDPNIPHASGSVSASESQTSNNIKNTDRESLSVTVKALEPNTAYSLVADTVGGSNFPAADFTTDKRGDAKVTLSTSPGKKGIDIGDLDPLTGVTELDVVDDSSTNGTGATVLSADTTSPKSFTFMDKQTQVGTNGTASGTVTVSASNRRAKLSLTASGLTAGQGYLISLNGTATTNSTFTASSKGTLRINTSITENVLDLNDVALTDTSSDVIIDFPFP